MVLSVHFLKYIYRIQKMPALQPAFFMSSK